MKFSSATVGRVVAATVDDAGGPIDERPVTLLHAIIHPPRIAHLVPGPCELSSLFLVS